MMLGEFDFADNFLFDKVKKDGDSNFSVQVIFIYGVSFLLFPITVPIDRILDVKNARAWVLMVSYLKK